MQGWRLQCRIGSRKVTSHARDDDRDPCFDVRERRCLVAGSGQDSAWPDPIPDGAAERRHGDTTGAGRSPAADAKRLAGRRAEGRRFSRTQARPFGTDTEHLQELLSTSCCRRVSRPLVIPGRRLSAGPGIQMLARCSFLDSGFACSRTRPGMTNRKRASLRRLIEAHDGGHSADEHGDGEAPEARQPVEQGPCGAASCEQQHAHCQT